MNKNRASISLRRETYDRVTLAAKRQRTSRSAILERAIANALEPTGEAVAYPGADVMPNRARLEMERP
jgi:predicted transcriptional regulator